MAFNDYLIRPGGLADQLTRARRDAGLTGAQLAERLRWGAPKVSKIERGRQKPSARDVQEWATSCGLGERQTLELLDLLEDTGAQHSQFTHRLRNGGAIQLQEEYDALVRDARLIRNFEMFAVPGLIQTQAYARAVQVRANKFHDAGRADIEAAVAAKMKRQEVLYEPDRKFEFIVLEYVLQPLLFSRDVMLGQLDKLLSGSGLANVSLGIVPAVQFPAFPQEGVLVADDVVIYETSAAEVIVVNAEAEAMVRRMNEFADAAIRDDDARQLILRAAESVRSGT